MLAAVTVLTALFSAAAVQVASAANGGKPPSGSGGHPPCPSCPDRTPPVGGNAGSGSGSGGGPTGGGNYGASVPTAPLISLGSISVANGIASVTGVVNAKAAVNAAVAVGATTANVHVSVNGNPVNVSAEGSFSASTSLAANGGLTIQAGELAAGVTYSISIPASAIPSGGTEVDALAQLNADRVTLMLPADGFTIVDGVGIDATVQVANITGIAGLSLNGTNLLAKLRLKIGGSGGWGSSSSSGSSGSSGSGNKPGGVKPGGGGSAPKPPAASVPVAGTAKHVKLTVTGTNGAQQTTTIRVQRIRSVVRIGRLLSISAFGARGIRISRITFDRSTLRSTGRIGVAVTVRDRRHYLVRDAVVMLQPYAQHTTIQGSWARMSNMLGRATFSVPVTSSSLGHRLYLRVIAQTPRSQTHLTASTFLMACGC